jgi:hypothetical protein
VVVVVAAAAVVVVVVAAAEVVVHTGVAAAVAVTARRDLHSRRSGPSANRPTATRALVIERGTAGVSSGPEGGEVGVGEGGMSLEKQRLRGAQLLRCLEPRCVSVDARGACTRTIRRGRRSLLAVEACQ